MPKSASTGAWTGLQAQPQFATYQTAGTLNTGGGSSPPPASAPTTPLPPPTIPPVTIPPIDLGTGAGPSIPIGGGINQQTPQLPPPSFPGNFEVPLPPAPAPAPDSQTRLVNAVMNATLVPPPNAPLAMGTAVGTRSGPSKPVRF